MTSRAVAALRQLGWGEAALMTGAVVGSVVVPAWDGLRAHHGTHSAEGHRAQEAYEGMAGAAASVFDASGRVAASIGVSTVAIKDMAQGLDDLKAVGDRDEGAALDHGLDDGHDLGRHSGQAG